MKTLLVALFAIAVGVGGGVWSAWALLDADVAAGRYVDGPWRATPGAYRTDANPYERARAAQRPVWGQDGSESLTFVAFDDDAGRPLDPACRYVITGARLPARRWSLSLSAQSSDTASNDGSPPLRRGFTSSELLRAEDQGFVITSSPDPEPGNWLPTKAPYSLIFNLYDTTLLSGITQERARLPGIRRADCAS